jgi:NAD(P)-dependent dehydrogenase (short-subunit alcohol dehydrogenase family)
MSNPSPTVALITGANKGIGFETAKQLGAKGIRVLIGGRDAARVQAAADSLKVHGVDARPIVIDVTSRPSIMAAVAQVEREHGKLDILINNAGLLIYNGDGLVSNAQEQVLRDTFETNFFGLFAVTQSFLPLIRKSEAGRIVNLTSILGSIAEHADPNSPIYQAKFTGYDASKAAVNMLTNHLAHELKGTPIKVNAAHPGWVKTDMGGPDAPMELVDGAKTSVWLATLPPDGPSGGFFHMQTHLRW